MRKSIVRGVIGVVALSVCCFLVTYLYLRQRASGMAEERVLLEKTEADASVIPDKYNTGASGLMALVALGDNVSEVQLVAGSNSTVNAMDFYYRNKLVSGTVVFKNMDFSAYPVAIYNGEKVDRDIHLVFENCKFSKVTFPKAEGLITGEFKDCTINSFVGGNAKFSRCRFGQSYSDGMVPYQNVQVSDCFFADFATQVSKDKAVHSDGTQIYGAKGIDVKNVTYRNCRFEVPANSLPASKATVNACIMLQMEYSNADGVYFEDCIVNGGGYSIYARSKSDKYSLDNISFDGIRIGNADQYGVFYSKMSDKVELENIERTDSLYVGSVWKEAGETHISVTNDTDMDRVLMVHTDKGTYQYAIASCPTKEQLAASVYENLPFDMDIVIPEACEYVVCFDATQDGVGKQIRYENWGDKQVYLDKSVYDKLFHAEKKIINYGDCGKEISYVLTSDGVLTLRGKGATYAYHSAKLPPWSAYKNQIRAVRVEAGITGLGNQLFQGYSSIEKVTLPEGLISIGGRTFANCSCLLEIVIPSTVESIGKAAFTNVMLQNVYYGGNEWGEIEIAEGNEWLCNKAMSLR